MPRFRIDMRVTEIHGYTVEAESMEAAVARLYEEDPKPDYIATESWEVEQIDEMMTDKDYYDGRKEFIESNEKIVLDEMVKS